jgi:hypothetical protein
MRPTVIAYRLLQTCERATYEHNLGLRSSQRDEGCNPLHVLWPW